MTCSKWDGAVLRLTTKDAWRNDLEKIEMMKLKTKLKRRAGESDCCADRPCSMRFVHRAKIVPAQKPALVEAGGNDHFRKGETKSLRGAAPAATQG